MVKDNNGMPIAIVGIIRDITKRKKLEQALKESERKYRMLVDNIHDGVFIIQDAKIQFVNKAFAALAGYTIEEIMGRDFRDFIAPEDKKMVEEHYFKRLLGEKVPEEYEFRVMHKDGKTRVAVLMRVGLINYRGKVASFGTVKDITKRKKYEEELTQSHAFLQSVIDGVAEPIMVIGMDYHVKLMNKAAKKFSHSSETLCYRISHKQDKPCSGLEHPCPLKEVKKSGKATIVLHEHYSNEEPRYVEILASPLWSKDGNLQGIIESFRDITERKRAEEAIRRYSEELEKSNRMKDLFTDIMSHDLLNPLSIASGYAEMLYETENDAKKKLYLATIEKNLQRCVELIENATLLSRLESKSIEFKEMDLNKIISNVIQNMIPMITKAGMVINCNLAENMLVKCNIIIEEVFYNLISNAVKYASHGKKIVIEGEERKHSYVVRVKDFGDGIKDEHKIAIFERFRRREKKGVKGSGLGLAIARKIVELHNGRIWVEDNVDRGAIFVVELPIANS